MTQENKELLLKDLCPRLPYDVKVWVKTHKEQIIESDFLTLCNGGGYYSTLSYEGILNDSVIKPYLRPLSSMTEKEKEEFVALQEKVIYNSNGLLMDDINKYKDFIYQHHLDDRHLIENGLALEATKSMYKIK